MEKLMTKEESYVERRKLFKNIWDTAMQMDAKDADIITKPKVIKTLRLDEVDRINIGNTKKQRIKNLRNVCKQLLDFCDRQDADDRFYEQKLASEGGERPHPKVAEAKPKKPKPIRAKRKIKKAKSYPPADTKPATSEGRDDFVPPAMKTAYPSVNRFKRTTVVKKPTKNLNPKPSPIREEAAKAFPGDDTPRRKVVKIKHNKKKRLPKAPDHAKVSVD